ncbi:MAG TPA: histidinol dehydrogenase [Conexibacter sp.]|nr:histidinol dehydrogenase [Conexibacter sp.]
MRLERRTLNGDPAALVDELRRLVPRGSDVSANVAEIIARVRAGGDEALEHFRRELDAGGAEPGPLRVSTEELETALAAIDPAVRAALELAVANVRAVAEAGIDGERETTLAQGQHVTLRELPVARAAVYVPGGRAPYPSTVVMGVVTARAAGVEEVVVCTPSSSPLILAACALAGAGEVYRVGGAHGIATLAYGTETVRPVDVIVGPGSLWVQEAKRQLSGVVGIDGFAGPSDLLVVLGGVGADARLAALDLRAQGEHGADSLVVAVSPDGALLDALAAALGDAPEPAPCVLVQAADLDAALAFAEAFAPEHLELIGADAEALAPRVTRAGCLFVGAGAATAFGDYVAGSNHVLPTDGAARFASGLSTRTFRRRMAEVRIDAAAAAALAPHGAALARAEGFAAHAESIQARIRENGAR